MGRRRSKTLGSENGQAPTSPDPSARISLRLSILLDTRRRSFVHQREATNGRTGNRGTGCRNRRRGGGADLKGGVGRFNGQGAGGYRPGQPIQRFGIQFHVGNEDNLPAESAVRTGNRVVHPVRTA